MHVARIRGASLAGSPREPEGTRRVRATETKFALEKAGRSPGAAIADELLKGEEIARTDRNPDRDAAANGLHAGRTWRSDSRWSFGPSGRGHVESDSDAPRLSRAQRRQSRRLPTPATGARQPPLSSRRERPA